MKTTTIYSLFYLLTTLTHCGSISPYEFGELSQFKIVPTALADQEAIKIIYASVSPDYNEELVSVWVDVAINKTEVAQKLIIDFGESDSHSFYDKYQNQNNITPIDWESCIDVLDKKEKHKTFIKS